MKALGFFVFLSILQNPIHDVKVYVYHAVESQTDSTPYITSNNFKINQDNPYSDRIIAVSQDLLEIYPYGSQVTVHIPGSSYSGTYTVQDIMNSRHKNSIDILINLDMPLICTNGKICLI